MKYNPKVAAIMESLPWRIARTIVSHKLLANNYVNADTELYAAKMKAVQDFAKDIARIIPIPHHTNQIGGKEFFIGAFVLTREQMEAALTEAYMQGRLDSPSTSLDIQKES
jgi:hypothetical protein